MCQLGCHRFLEVPRMYLHMVQATDIAIRILIEAQQTCDDFYPRSQNRDTLESTALDPTCPDRTT